MSKPTETYKKTTEAVNAAGEKIGEAGTTLYEETVAGVIAASEYTVEKTKEGLAYAQEKSQPTIDAVARSVHDGLKTISKNIDAAAEGVWKEEKEPTAWEQTKTGVSDAVDAVTQSVQSGADAIGKQIDAAADSLAEEIEADNAKAEADKDNAKVEV